MLSVQRQDYSSTIKATTIEHTSFYHLRRTQLTCAHTLQSRLDNRLLGPIQPIPRGPTGQQLAAAGI